MKKKKNKTNNDQRATFPGYPPYPASEDITINGRRVSIDDEGKAKTEEKLKRLNDPDDDLIDKKSNLTKDDLQALGPRDQSLDDGDDELLRLRGGKVDFSGKDLDVPGSELDDENEEIGSEDEENNSYSIGGDNHNDLEERQD
jgi:hypothetical protein